MNLSLLYCCSYFNETEGCNQIIIFYTVILFNVFNRTESQAKISGNASTEEGEEWNDIMAIICITSTNLIVTNCYLHQGSIRTCKLQETLFAAENRRGCIRPILSLRYEDVLDYSRSLDIIPNPLLCGNRTIFVLLQGNTLYKKMLHTHLEQRSLFHQNKAINPREMGVESYFS